MRHRITIEQPVRSADSYGAAESVSWSTFATVWASKEDLSGKEFFVSRQENSEVSTRFRLRYLDGVTAEMRIVCDGLTYELVSPPINPDGKKREMHLMTTLKAD